MAAGRMGFNVMIGFYGTSGRRHRRAALSSLLLLGAFALSPERASAEDAGQGCPVPPTVSAEISAKGVYRTGTDSVDRDALAYNKASLAKLDTFIKMIGDLGDAAMKGDAAAARCFGATMSKWVATDPLTASDSGQASFSQQWSLASISLAIIKAQAGGARITPEVERWLRKVSDQVRAFHDAQQLKNNHAAWAALAVGGAAYILHDNDAWRWAMAREAMIIDQIQDDGTLPREMMRGPRASSYHVFTAMPLLSLNLLRRCRGGLDPRQSDRVQRLERLLNAIDANQQFLASRTSSQQFPTTAMYVVNALEGTGAPNASTEKLGGNIDNLRAVAARCR